MQSGTDSFNETSVQLRVLHKLESHEKREAVTDVICSREKYKTICCYKMCLRMNAHSCV
jgi:hypothetical protein